MLNGLPDSMSQLYLIPLIFSIGNPTYSKVILLSRMCCAYTAYLHHFILHASRGSVHCMVCKLTAAIHRYRKLLKIYPFDQTHSPFLTPK